MTQSLPFDLLACPECHGALARDDGSLHCESCGAAYSALGHTPDLVPAALAGNLVDGGDPGWARWREAIRGLDAWRAARIGPVARKFDDGTSDHANRALFDRAGIKGVVVDVGAKDGAKSNAMKGVTRYIGVDPFPSQSAGLPAHATLVRGLAEALPLRDRVADGVVCVSAFDYFQDGYAAIEEMARVLKPDGRLAMLVSVVTSTVAHARGARNRVSRITSALRAVREVGIAAGAGLVGAAVLERHRPHTQYYTRNQITSMIGVRFEIEGIEESRQPASTILYLHARKKRSARLRVIE